MSQTQPLPKQVAAKEEPLHAQRIPYTLFQTFKNTDVPEGMRRAALSWIENNPEYEYRFHDDDDCRRLIQEHFDTTVLRAFDSLNVGAFKADLWRYCALHVHGGVYADIDTVSVTPLREVIDPEDEFVTVFAGAVSGGIFNAFICSTPGHPFLQRTIEEAVSRILSGRADHPLAITGPLCMGRAINQVLGRDRNTEFTAGNHRIKGYSFKILEKKRSPDPLKRSVVYEGKTVLMCKYEGYDSDLKQSGQKHWMGFFQPQ